MRRMRSLLFVLLACLGLAPSALGHPLLQDAMWVQIESSRVHIAVNVSVRELAVAQGLNLRDDGFDPAPASAAAERHREYLPRHLIVSTAGRALPGQVVGITPPRSVSEPEKSYFQYEIVYPFDGPLGPVITIAHDMLREWPYAAGTPWDVTYLVRMKRSDSEEITSALLTSRAPVEFSTGAAVDDRAAPASSGSAAGSSATARVFGEYFRHGVMHILNGWDHLLFVAALVIATMNFWEMVKVIAAFTLAHTITLALSVFDIFRLPSAVVEPMIAASIVFVAIENVFWPQRAHSRLRLAVAFGFGLIHGLGFAGGLLDAMQGLPRVSAWAALAAFSLGVEIGHQTVVLPLFGTLAICRRKLGESMASPTLRIGSALISLCGAYYFCVALHAQVFGR